MKKKVIAGICLLVMTGLCPLQVNAQGVVEENKALAEYGGEISARADVIETVFRVNEGTIQYRRWNKTEGYWIDPDWIDL